jgi:superfamily II DNA or RNA helicase
MTKNLELRPKQLAAIRRIVTHSAVGVFADMGAGKTAIVLHAMMILPHPVLLVGPIRVIEGVWQPEAELWQAIKDHGFTWSLVRGTPAQRLKALAKPADVYLINPDLLHWLFTLSARVRPKFKTLVIDESSQFKDSTTRRFKALRKKLRSFQHRIILTGTPSPNGLMNLWSQIFILDRGDRLEKLKTYFKARYFEQDAWSKYKYTPVPGAYEKITKRISDIVIRIKQPREFPAKHIPQYFELNAKTREQYDELEAKAFADIGAGVSAPIIITKFTKLRQLTGGFVYDDDRVAQKVHEQKLDLVQEIIEETGSPVMVIYQYKHELAALQKRFPNGKKYRSDADRVSWNRGKIDILFLYPSSGYGLNLQKGGHTIIVYSSSFSQEQMSQSFARLDRPGQKEQVYVHWLLARDTIDELLYTVIKTKTDNQDLLLDRIMNYAYRKRVSHRKGVPLQPRTSQNPVPRHAHHARPRQRRMDEEGVA